MNLVADIWEVFKDDIKDRNRKQRAVLLLEVLEDNGVFDPTKDSDEIAEAYGTCDYLDAALDEYLEQFQEVDEEEDND